MPVRTKPKRARTKPKGAAPGPLPSGVLPALRNRRPVNDAFARAMRERRQTDNVDARDRLWNELFAMASAGRSAPNPFTHSHHRPSALDEAVSSGEPACLDLVALADSARGQLPERIHEAGVDGDKRRHMAVGSALTTVLSFCFLGVHRMPGTSAPMIRKLVSMGAHPDGCALAPGHPLVTFVGMGDVEGARTLIELGADALRPLREPGSEYAERHGDTLLHYAARRRDRSFPMHDMLVEAGMDPCALNGHGQTPMQVAMETYANFGDIGLLREAIARGPDPRHCPSKGGGTLLHAALRNPNSTARAMHDFLTALGVDRLARDHSGAGPLETAHRSHHAWTAPLLLHDKLDEASRKLRSELDSASGHPPGASAPSARL